MMTYKLDTPVNVGNLHQSVQVSELALSSISINFEPHFRDKGHAVMSVVLHDVKTGYPVNVVYQDQHSLSLARAIEKHVGEEIFKKIVDDGKLPAAPGAIPKRRTAYQP